MDTEVNKAEDTDYAGEKFVYQAHRQEGNNDQAQIIMLPSMMN